MEVVEMKRFKGWESLSGDVYRTKEECKLADDYFTMGSELRKLLELVGNSSAYKVFDSVDLQKVSKGIIENKDRFIEVLSRNVGVADGKLSISEGVDNE
jgi:hypothetical protein